MLVLGHEVRIDLGLNFDFERLVAEIADVVSNIALQGSLRHRQPLRHTEQLRPPLRGPGDPPDFTCSRLMIILEEVHHSIVIVEHSPMLYEEAEEMVE